MESVTPKRRIAPNAVGGGKFAQSRGGKTRLWSGAGLGRRTQGPHGLTQKYNSPGYDAISLNTNGDVILGAAKNGLDTALTHDAGSSDPSSGATVAWGAADVGRLWLDTTTAALPVLKMWCQLTAGPTYGWRTLRLLKTKHLSAPQAVTFSPASPAAADVAWADVDLTTLLDTAGVQDTGDTARTVAAVLLRVRVAAGASETLPGTGSDGCYFAVKAKGSTQDKRVYPQVADRYVEAEFWTALDSDEIFEFMVDVGGGTPNFRYAAWVVAFAEAV